MSVQDPPRAFTGQLPPPNPPVDGQARRPLAGAAIALMFGAPALILIIIGVVIWTRPESRRLETEAAQARQRVIEIINQPVTPIPRSDTAYEVSPGWFHPGAIKPDFDTVDVRSTQEFPYDAHQYVTSDVTPAQMFRSSEVEFNAMTKVFYVDRQLPKKRLSQAEMLQINRLYRVIGHGQHVSTVKWETAAGLFGSAFFMLLAMGFQLRRPD